MAFRDTAFFLDVQIATKTIGNVMFAEKELFVLAGQIVASSGDGLAAFGASSDVIASGSSGANGFNNDLAWVRIQLKNGREIIYQMISIASGTARIKYATTPFTGGAPSATQVPSAADEVIALGGGSDAVPTGVAWINNLAGGDAVRRLFGAVDSASPSGFWFSLRSQENFGTNDHCWALDPITPFTVVDDDDPYVLILGFGSSSLKWDQDQMQLMTSSAMILQGWYNKSTTGPRATLFQRVTGQFSPGWDNEENTSGNPNNDAWDLCPIMYERNQSFSEPSGVKGFGTLVWGYQPVDDSADPVAGRRQTFNVNGVDNAFLRMIGCALPWDGSLPADEDGVYVSTDANLWVQQDKIVNPAPSRFRMRANDSVLSEPVYWDAPFIDGTGSLYPGPGVPSSIVATQIA